MSVYSSLILGESSLQSYWRLGEALGAATASDQKGAVNGTYVFNSSPAGSGQPGLILGDPDFSAKFVNAAGDSVQMGNFYQFLGRAAYTVECWIKIVNYPASGQTVVNNARTPGGWQIAIDDTFNWKTRRSDGVADDVYIGFTDATQALIGRIVHFAVTYDGTLLNLYKNGVVQGAGLSSTLSVTAGADFRIGFHSLGGSGANGWIDEVAVYNVALTSAQLLAHYTVGVSQQSLLPQSVSGALRT